MSDITKCDNKLCSIKEHCFRQTSPSSQFQSYAAWRQDSDSKCDGFYDAEKLKTNRE